MSTLRAALDEFESLVCGVCPGTSRRAGYFEPSDLTAPLMSEAALYFRFGKDDARHILAVWKKIRAAAAEGT